LTETMSYTINYDPV